MNPAEGSHELLRVEYDQVLVSAADATMTEPATVHGDRDHALYVRLQRLGVRPINHGFTVSVHHAMPPRVEVYNATRQRFEKASSGVTKAVMEWYVNALHLHKRAAQ